MSATTLTSPIPMDLRVAHRRPALGRLVTVELRKILGTRAGFWMQVATVALTAIVVIGRLVSADAADRTFSDVLTVALKPAAVLLPVAGILLVTSEWSQRTGMITFALIPRRSRIVGAKLIAAVVLAFAMLAVCIGIAAAGVLGASPDIDGVWTDATTLIAQSSVYIVGGMVTGVAFGMVLLASAPALVALFGLPSAWAALLFLPVFGDVGRWLDTGRSLSPMTQEVLTGTQWAQAGTSLALWMLLPLLIGTWRITRREIAA
ncbi:MAG: ABC transporter permease [Solirubrobacteraceae bacterium]